MRRVWRLELPVAADVDRDVVRVVVPAEQEEGAGLQLRARNRRSVVHLRIGVAWDRQPVRAVEIPDQAGAVEAPGAQAAPEVVRAEEPLALRDDRRVARRKRWRGSSDRAHAV